MTPGPTTPTPEQQARYDVLFDEVFPLYEERRYDEALARLAARGAGL